MATNKSKQPVRPAAVAAKKSAPQPAAKVKTTSAAGNINSLKPSVQAFLAIGVVVLTYLFLKGSLGNLFTNWDDPGYVVDDPLIKNITADGIKNIFSLSNPVMGNYHPLTILSYGIEYSYVRLEPWLYHFDSLFFHLVCTALVYWLINLLTRRPIAAAITALLFGIHPMHVESVAWVAGRKDVLYGMFYLLACVVYVYAARAVGSRKWLFYTGVLVLFICSLLSKPVAVSLPLVLILIDFFENKLWTSIPSVENVADKLRINYRLLAEKIPFFAIAVIFGIKSVADQHRFGALNTLGVKFNPLERFALGCYALITYLWKAVVPVSLSCFYPYPIKENDALPVSYYIYPLIFAVLLFVVFRFARKSKAVVFGLLFFLANIGLLLQFIPVGGAILADRYTYIPYVGLFFIVGWFVSLLLEKAATKQLGYVAGGAVLAWSLSLGYLSSQRCNVWYNAVTLWTNEIEEHPTVPNAYNNLGFYYKTKMAETVNPQEKKKYYDSSYNLLNKSISLQPSFVNPYISLGELERTIGLFPEAKKNYFKALSLKSDDEDANAYLGLAIIYAISNNLDSSSYCFHTALQMKENFPEAHSNYGNLLDMMHKNDSSLAQYAIAISQNPDMFEPFLNRGRELQRLNRCAEALQDFEHALELSPDNGEVYYSRSFCYFQQGNKSLALHDIEKAASLGFTQVDKAYYDKVKGQ